MFISILILFVFSIVIFLFKYSEWKEKRTQELLALHALGVWAEKYRVARPQKWRRRDAELIKICNQIGSDHLRQDSETAFTYNVASHYLSKPQKDML